MAGSNFIRGIEVWTPSPDGAHLDLTSGLYGDLDYFGAISRGMRQGRDEGLPGRVLSERHPVVLKTLSHTYFRRGDAAMTEGLTCAVGVPVAGSSGIGAVVVFLCGDTRFHAGALELWHAPAGADEMRLADGYFGHAGAFEALARETVMARGVGVPGLAWESGLPVILRELGAGSAFVRGPAAVEAGINRAVGIPCGSGNGDGDTWVLTFLSARKTPIAGRFECWRPDGAGGLRFAGGYCESGADLESAYAGLALPADTGDFGAVATSGLPRIVRDIIDAPGPVAESARQAGLASMVILPVFAEGTCRALLAWFV